MSQNLSPVKFNLYPKHIYICIAKKPRNYHDHEYIYVTIINKKVKYLISSENKLRYENQKGVMLNKLKIIKNHAIMLSKTSCDFS